MGLPDPDFYLLFLSKVPQGFLPQTYSDGEKCAIPVDLLLEALVCLNNLIPCFLFLFFMFLEIREMFIFFCSSGVKNYDGCHEGPTIYILSKKKPHKKTKKPERKYTVTTTSITLTWLLEGMAWDSSRNSASSGEITVVFWGQHSGLEGPAEPHSRKAPGNY